MRFLWRQMGNKSVLTDCGIFELCFKSLSLRTDNTIITNKPHHHSEFEIHFIIKGRQYYEVENQTINLSSGHFLLIAPKVQHRVIGCEENTEKLAISFQYTPTPKFFTLPEQFTYCVNQILPLITSGLRFSALEAEQKTELSRLLIENRMVEVLTHIFRTIGLKENTMSVKVSDVPAVLLLAIGYIKDNIESPPTQSEVANYCHLSERQLSRIFVRYKAMTIFEYICTERIAHAKQLLDGNILSLSEISERMNFPDEHYFNKFFKKGYGMPPGTYRKSMK